MLHGYITMHGQQNIKSVHTTTCFTQYYPLPMPYRHLHCLLETRFDISGPPLGSVTYGNYFFC